MPDPVRRETAATRPARVRGGGQMTCRHCGNDLPENRRKWCSNRCQVAGWRAENGIDRQRAREAHARYHDKDPKRERQAQYRAENREETNAKARQYRAEHRDEINARLRARAAQKRGGPGRRHQIVYDICEQYMSARLTGAVGGGEWVRPMELLDVVLADHRTHDGMISHISQYAAEGSRCCWEQVITNITRSWRSAGLVDWEQSETGDRRGRYYRWRQGSDSAAEVEI